MGMIQSRRLLRTQKTAPVPGPPFPTRVSYIYTKARHTLSLRHTLHAWTLRLTSLVECIFLSFVRHTRTPLHRPAA